MPRCAALVALAGVWAAGACKDDDAGVAGPAEPPNRNPVAVGSIAAQTLFLGDTVTVDVASSFGDPDGDRLVFEAASSDPAVARAAASGSRVSVIALTRGAASVTVTARDPGGREARQAFHVTIPNRPPVVAEEISAQALFLGETVTVDVSAAFSDPDGDALSFRVASSDTTTAGASAAASEVTVEASARGTATITVTARDPDGGEAGQRFDVTIPNREPEAADEIAAQSVFLQETITVDLSSAFSDPDGDTLTFRAASSDTAVVLASASRNGVTLEARRRGTAAVTVTARDAGGGESSQRFEVTVPNREPEAADEIAEQSLFLRETIALDLSTAFRDPDDDSLALAATSSDTSVVRVVAADYQVTIEAVSRGTTTVTVTAHDPWKGEARNSFPVIVPNREPAVTRALPAQTLSEGRTTTLKLASYFSDADGDSLAYSTSTSDAAVADASVAGSTVTLEGISPGSASATVTTRDLHGGETRQSFDVTVESPPSPPSTNRAPTVTDAMPDLHAEEGTTLAVSGSPYFSDPDGDDLSFTGTSSNPSVATVGNESPTSLSVVAASTGAAEITVTASDPGGLTNSESFTLTVIRYSPPEVTGSPPDLVTVPGATDTMRVDSYFRGSPLGGHLTFGASSSDPAVAAATVLVDPAAGTSLIVTGIALGEATITMSAADHKQESASVGFLVNVESNRAPRVRTQIAGRYVTVGHSISWNLDDYFTDPDGDTLTYDVSGGTAVTVDLTGASLTITGVSPGQVDVGVTATDPGGRTASQSFPFLVIAG